MDLLVLIDAVQTTDCDVCVLMKLGKTPQHMHRKVFKAGWILLLHHRSNNIFGSSSSKQHAASKSAACRSAFRPLNITIMCTYDLV